MSTPRFFPEHPESKHLNDLKKRVHLKKQHVRLVGKEVDELRDLLRKYGESTAIDDEGIRE